MMSSPEKHVLESHLIWIFVPNRIVFVSPSFSLGRCSEITWRGTLGKMFIFLRRNIPEEDNMEEEEEKDNDDDILAKVTNFVDRNLRVFKSLSWVLAGAGVFFIFRGTFVFRQFKAVSDVPTEFVVKNISLHGQVKEVRQDHTLGICHIPLLKGIRNMNFQTATSSQSNLLIVSLPGVEFREGGQKWLADNMMSVKVHMTPLQVTNDDTLDCILFKKEGWFSSMCVNEELVRQGVAVTCHVPTLTNSPPYVQLQKRLLKAELRAEKKGVGIWVRPSLSEKLQRVLSVPVDGMKKIISTVQNVSFRRLFSRKTAKADDK